MIRHSDKNPISADGSLAMPSLTPKTLNRAATHQYGNGGYWSRSSPFITGTNQGFTGVVRLLAWDSKRRLPARRLRTGNGTMMVGFSHGQPVAANCRDVCATRASWLLTMS